MSFWRRLKKTFGPWWIMPWEAERQTRSQRQEQLEQADDRVCRICGYHTTVLSYCPSCLAFSLRPGRSARPAHA